MGSRDKSYRDWPQCYDLLSLKSRRTERDMHTVFKLIHGLHGITLEDAGLFLCNSFTRGSGVRLKQSHVINRAITCACVDYC